MAKAKNRQALICGEKVRFVYLHYIMAIFAVNKRAKFDYEIGNHYEAGMVLFGHEVKSVKTGHASLKGAFVTFKKDEAYLTNAFIPPYKFAGDIPNYDPARPRKLLLKKKELAYLLGKRKTEGLTLVPLTIRSKHGLIKLEFGIGKGRKKYDKRDVIKKRDIDRRIRTLTKK
jgi:SsrA-binding protein